MNFDDDRERARVHAELDLLLLRQSLPLRPGHAEDIRWFRDTYVENDRRYTKRRSERAP